MRFKREDIGLYFASALIGGGLGLLLGALATAQINKKREEKFYAEEAARDDNIDRSPANNVTVNWYKEEPTEEKVKEVVINTVNRKETWEIGTDPVAKSGLEMKLKPMTREKFRISKEDRKELARLSEEYVINALQVELVEKGTITVEELEESLIDADFDQDILELPEEDESDNLDLEDHIDYSQVYRDDKPEMDELLNKHEKPLDDDGPRELGDLLVVVDSKWEIRLEPPTNKGARLKRTIYFDPDDETVYTKSGAGDIVSADLRVITTKAVRDIIYPWLLFEKDIEAIYIDDISSTKSRWYEIIRLKDEEDENVDW